MEANFLALKKSVEVDIQITKSNVRIPIRKKLFHVKNNFDV